MEISAISVGESVEVVPDMFREGVSSQLKRFDSATFTMMTISQQCLCFLSES
jgi:hypothetical protein